MPCGWEGNRRSGVTLAMSYSRQWFIHLYGLKKGDAHSAYTGNETDPKITINDTMNLFFKTAFTILVISNHNSFRVLFDKIASVGPTFYLKKYMYILALEMASPGIQHCASCIGTLSFRTLLSVAWHTLPL